MPGNERDGSAFWLANLEIKCSPWCGTGLLTGLPNGLQKYALCCLLRYQHRADSCRAERCGLNEAPLQRLQKVDLTVPALPRQHSIGTVFLGVVPCIGMRACGVQDWMTAAVTLGRFVGLPARLEEVSVHCSYEPWLETPWKVQVSVRACDIRVRAEGQLTTAEGWG